MPRRLCFLLLLLLSPSARAIESLDWLIADSDLVIRGRVIKVAQRHGSKTSENDWEEATIAIDETLKGPTPSQNQIKFLRPTSKFTGSPWSEDPALFLLVDARRTKFLNPPDFVKGRYLLLDPENRVIPLNRLLVSSPQDIERDYRGRWFPKTLYNHYGQTLRDRDEILSEAHTIISEQGTHHPPLHPARIDMIDRGSITVPADTEWRRRAEKNLANGQPLIWIASMAISGAELREFDTQYRAQPYDYYKNDQTVSFLFQVLDDPWGTVQVTQPHHWPTPLDEFEFRHHINRQLARNVLSSWDINVPEPILNSPLLRREPIPLNPYLLAALCLIFLPILTARRKPLFLRSLTWLCTLLTIATLALWLRSASRYDSLIYATHSFEHEISSSFGQIHFLALTGGPPAEHPLQRTPSHASVSLKDMDLVPHHLNYLLPDRQWNHAGIALAQGLTPPAPRHDWPATPAVSYSYRLITLRYPWLVALFFFLPALRTLSAMRRTVRTLQRIRNLHCPHCNYDLRHRPRRCPECGQLTPAFICDPSPSARAL